MNTIETRRFDLGGVLPGFGISHPYDVSAHHAKGEALEPTSGTDMGGAFFGPLG